MNRLPYIAVFFAAVFLVAADKKQSNAAPSAAQIQLWVKQLGDDEFKVREKATRDLINAGGAAIDAVAKATNSNDAEVKQRALMIIKPIEKEAIAYFKRLGAKVTVDEKSPGRTVIGLNPFRTQVTDAGLVHLKVFTKLNNLDLIDSKVTDAGLVHLKGLNHLRVLQLYNTKITDAGLVHLQGLTSLRSLWLNRTKVTDDGLVNLKGLTKLRKLYLVGTKVTQAGIDKLRKSLPKCDIRWDGM